MNTCATCKYKGAPYVHENYDDGELIEVKTAFHECQKIYFDSGGDNIPRHLKAYIVDGSGYYAALRCTDDFGRIDWEPK